MYKNKKIIPNFRLFPAGACHCYPGWTGSNCTKSCRAGTYGINCGLQCKCQNGGACRPIDGACHCKPGYTGLTCSEGGWRFLRPSARQSHWFLYCLLQCAPTNITATIAWVYAIVPAKSSYVTPLTVACADRVTQVSYGRFFIWPSPDPMKCRQ